MSMQDPISDMLTRIRNGHMSKKSSVDIPSSTVKQSIASVLKDEGYINSYEVVEGSDIKKTLKVGLKYYEGKPVINKISRVSRPGLRNYKASADLPKVLGGLGIAVVSTSKGVMSDRIARKEGLGGEVICFIQWGEENNVKNS